MSHVICYGSIIADRVLRLPRFPQPGEGIHAVSDTLYLGGEPCNVGGHLAAWGVPVTLAGNNLGRDPLGTFVRSKLSSRSNTAVVVRDDSHIQTPTCYIWTTPDGERTLIPSWPTPTGWTLPDDACVRESRLVSVSIYGPGMDAMIDLARQHGKPLAVADITGPHDSRLAGAAIVTTSRSVLRLRHGVDDAESWLRAVQAASDALVVVSDGPRPALVMTHDGRLFHAVPPSIQPVDTTGAGDAFKAGVIYGWLHDWPVDQMLRWAIAAASLQCLRPGACDDVPAPAEIESMMPAVITHHAEERGGDTETRRRIADKR